MKLIPIIAIILILALPATSISQAEFFTQTTQVNNFDYNFTGMPLGSFPGNSSWIGFSTVNLSSYSTINVQKVMGTRGLQVSTFGYGGAGNQFLNMSIKPTFPFSMKITFSWNFNNSVLSTGNIIEIANGSQESFNYHFGTLYNKNTYLSGNKTSLLGSEPNYTEFYTLSLSWEGVPDQLYSNIVRGWNVSGGMPYTILPKSPFNGSDFNLLLGGTNSNVTIYNIYVSNNTGVYTVPKYQKSIDFHQESIDANLNSTMVNSTNWLPLVDYRTNSLLYYGNNPATGIYAYNYYNNTTRQLIPLTSGYHEVTASNNSEFAYFLVSDRNASVFVTINLTSLKPTLLDLNITFSTETYIFSFNQGIYLIAENGTLERINGTGEQLKPLSLVEQNMGKLVSSSYLNGNLTVSFVNPNGSRVSQYRVNPNGSLAYLKPLYVQLLDVLFSPVTVTGSLPTAAQVVGNITGYNETIFWESQSSAALVSPQNYSIMKSSGSQILLKGNGYIYDLSGTSIISTNLAVDSSFAYISANQSFALSITGNRVNIYYTGIEPFSGSNLSVNFSPPKVISGNISIPYSVTSSLNYSIQASVGSLTLTPEEGYVNFSSYDLPNGTYTIELTARNLAGYSASRSVSVSIDNFIPLVTTEPGNNSQVLENSTLTLNITGLNGSVSSTVQFDNLTVGNYTGNLIKTYFPAISGNVTILLNVTDEFGISRCFTFHFQVDSVNTSGYSANIKPDSYLANGDINLSWTSAEFVEYYTVSLVSNSSHFRFNTTHNYTNLNLDSGAYTLGIEALLRNSSLMPLVNENFTVQLFNPLLNLSFSNSHYFSFFGNSTNNTLNIHASSNISVNFLLNIQYNSTTVDQADGSGNSFYTQLNSTSEFLKNNGFYTVNISAVEKSGRISWRTFNFSVNNSLPARPLDFGMLYTNKSNPALPIKGFENVSTYYYYKNGTFGSYLTGSNSTVVLSGLRTNITVVSKNIWGNYNWSNLTIIEESARPSINAEVNSKVLIWNNTVQLNYVIQDPVNLSFVSINLNSVPVYNSTSRAGKVNITLPEDGNYTVFLTTRDLCGNFNSTNISGIVSEYYPTISGISTSIVMFMGIAHLGTKIKGTDLESVNYTWIIDGSTISGSKSIYTILLPGEHNITLELSYHSSEIDSVHHVYTYGFIPEGIVLLILASILTYRRYRGSNDHELAASFVMENLGKSRREIMSTARKGRIRVSNVKSVIMELSSTGKIRLMPDPDGVVYVMPSKDRN